MAQLPALDTFPYIGQEEDSLACVPCCVEMVCEFFDIQKDRSEIEEELGFSVDRGTPFSNIGLLSGVRAFKVASVEDAFLELDRGVPVIANLRIRDQGVLGYAADTHFLHAVVMVGFDAAFVLSFDPLAHILRSTTEVTVSPRLSFELAWLHGWVLLPK